jgi:hypothetical protein
MIGRADSRAVGAVRGASKNVDADEVREHGGVALGAELTIVCAPDHASITELEVNDRALRLITFGAEMRVDDVR